MLTFPGWAVVSDATAIQSGRELLPGSSKEQRDAERVMLDLLSQQLGRKLEPAKLAVPSGERVEVDGADADRSILVELSGLYVFDPLATCSGLVARAYQAAGLLGNVAVAHAIEPRFDEVAVTHVDHGMREPPAKQHGLDMRRRSRHLHQAVISRRWLWGRLRFLSSQARHPGAHPRPIGNHVGSSGQDTTVPSAACVMGWPLPAAVRGRRAVRAPGSGPGPGGEERLHDRRHAFGL